MIHELWLRIKRFILPYPIAYATKYALKVLLWTCRFKVEGLEALTKTAKEKRCILMLWHNRIAILPEFLKRHTKEIRFAALISKSRDGEPVSLLAESYSGGRAIRVAHDKRHFAIKQAISQLKYCPGQVVVITPDGPRGPRYKLKSGILTIASASNAHIIPLSWTASRYWTLNTWDRFMLPKPFSTISVSIGAPIPPQTTEETLTASLCSKKP